MGRKAKELSPLAIGRLKGPGMHFVGGVDGLALQVLPSGARSWILRVMVGGRRREMGLGGFPDVTVAGAREAARQARSKIRAGIDPIEEAKAARSALRAAAAKSITFREAAEAYIGAHETRWKNEKHRAQWGATLETYAFPEIGALAVGDIELPHVLAVLEPIWVAKTETASRVRGRVETILNWSIARGHRSGPNPARWRGHLDQILPRPSSIQKVSHHPAVPVSDAGAFMADLRTASGTGARALELVILTAVRSGEARGAQWAEMDLDKAVWTIPGERMKAGREHRVPLSPDAIKLLRKLPRDSGSLVFPGPRGGPLSDMTLLSVMRRMGSPAVPHGFRSTFRDWAAERTAYPHEVCEMALAHTIGSKVEAAYRRGDLFEKRRRMMKDWAVFLSRPLPVENVAPIRAMRGGT